MPLPCAKLLTRRAWLSACGVYERSFRDAEALLLCREHKTYIRSLATALSHPTWMVRRWLQQFGHAQTVALCKSNNAIPTFGVRVNPLQTTMEDVEEVLVELEVSFERSTFLPDTFFRCAQLHLRCELSKNLAVSRLV